jgi:hypothetical protein
MADMTDLDRAFLEALAEGIDPSKLSDASRT